MIAYTRAGADSASEEPKAKALGQREYYIPSYNNPETFQQRSQAFIYPNNFRNAYQYSQNKYKNRVPDVLNQKWSSSPLLGNSVHRIYRYNRPVVGDSSADSSDNEFDSDSTNNGFPYERPEKLNLRPNTNQNSDYNSNRNERLEAKSKSKSTDNGLKNKAKDFSDEQQRLTKAEELTIEQEYKDQDNNDKEAVQRMSEALLGPVMRRKAASSSSMHTSALQASDQRGIPVPMARHQSADTETGSMGDIYFVGMCR